MPSLARCPSSVGSVPYSLPIIGLEALSLTYGIRQQGRSGAQPVELPLALEPPAARQAAMPMPRAYSLTIQVGFDGDAPVRFLSPYITLRVSDEDLDGIYVVTDSFSSMYGEGESEEEAVTDYLASLIGHYLDLDANRSVLAPGLRQELESMSRYIGRAR